MTAYALIQVVISLVAILSGFVVMFGMLTAPWWNSTQLAPSRTGTVSTET